METKEKLSTVPHCSFDELRETIKVSSTDGECIGRRSLGKLNAYGIYSIYARYYKFANVMKPKSAIRIHKIPQNKFLELNELQQAKWETIASWNANGLMDRIDYVNYLILAMCRENLSYNLIPNKPEEILAELERFESKSAFEKSKEFLLGGIDTDEYRVSPEFRKYGKSPLGLIVSEKEYPSFAINALDQGYINLAFYRKLAEMNWGKWDFSNASPKDRHLHKLLGVMQMKRMPKFLKYSK